MSAKNRPPKPTPTDFQRHAEQRQPGLLRELLAMSMQHKKWWLIPIVVMVVALGLIVFLGGTAAAPFIYTLF
jgi:hypothetical protein